jgi:prepilin-type N-terminal cleavage/methylation domain-containing protein
LLKDLKLATTNMLATAGETANDRSSDRERHLVGVKSGRHSPARAIAFTLIELLVVIAIIAILAAMLLP